MPHIKALDGWRGISILLVLAGHMFAPLGFKLNVTLAATGMALFFTLSGFLITETLLHQPSVPQFLIRRCCRILPLAWPFSLVALYLAHAPIPDYPAHFLFYANLPPFWLTPITGHLWSLCVEMQFYVFVALLCLLIGLSGLGVLPLACLSITAARIINHQPTEIVTWFRADEILAGASLSLLFYTAGRDRVKRALWLINPYIFILLLIGASHPDLPWLNYFRPYIATSLVGCTVLRERGILARALSSKILAYIAKISYALYVLHPITYSGWLLKITMLARYAMRPIWFVMAFATAHLSTNYYERYWIEWGRKWSKQISRQQNI
jgi:peptidoglycan/LPS O-acetylase OafA/YrhL